MPAAESLAAMLKLTGLVWLMCRLMTELQMSPIDVQQ